MYASRVWPMYFQVDAVGEDFLYLKRLLKCFGLAAKGFVGVPSRVLGSLLLNGYFEEMDEDPDLAYSNRPFLGSTISGIQVGLGPAGKLRYPSCPSKKQTCAWRFCELGEFSCYDKFMLASLKACAREFGMQEWGNGSPFGGGKLVRDPEYSEFFQGCWLMELPR
ncbi:beta-amylase [Sarracenia purpurea var. burkii]